MASSTTKQLRPRWVLTVTWFAIPAMALFVAGLVITYQLATGAAYSCLNAWAENDFKAREIRTQASIEKSKAQDELFQRLLAPKDGGMPTSAVIRDAYGQYVTKANELAQAQGTFEYQSPEAYCEANQ